MTKISSTWQERSWEAKSISDNKEIFLLFLLHSFILYFLPLICATENLFAFFFASHFRSVIWARRNEPTTWDPFCFRRYNSVSYNPYCFVQRFLLSGFQTISFISSLFLPQIHVSWSTKIMFVEFRQQCNFLPSKSLLVAWCTNSLTFNNCTFCPHCICVFCIYLRTNSDFCHLQHKLIGFYNRDEKCLQRGTDWVFK